MNTARVSQLARLPLSERIFAVCALSYASTAFIRLLMSEEQYSAAGEEILIVATTDLNHYEDEATTQKKDALAISQLEAMNAGKLYEVCRSESISMCGLGSAVALLVALKKMQATRAEVVQHATSAAISGDYGRVVGYAGMIFD